MNTRSRLLTWLPALLLGPVLALCSTLALAESPAEAAKPCTCWTTLAPITHRPFKKAR
jgi:hypothetical protein